MSDKLKTWHFGTNNDKLVQLVLLGKKTACTSLYDENDIPKIGEESILTFADGTKACITKTKNIIITEFKNIDENLSQLEGEGTFELWKKEHVAYFKRINPNFNDETKVLFRKAIDG